MAFLFEKWVQKRRRSYPSVDTESDAMCSSVSNPRFRMIRAINDPPIINGANTRASITFSANIPTKSVKLEIR